MKTDFQTIIKDLRAANYSDAQIARLCKCSRQHIGNIGKGDVAEVGYSIGRQLEKLHEAIYRVTRQREYTIEGFRRAAD